MKQRYTPEGVQELKQKARRSAMLTGITGAVTLLACVCLCFGIRTANAEARQWVIIGLTTLGAGVALWLLEGVRLPALREALHEEGVLREPVEQHQGEIVRLEAVHPIPRSIAFVPVTLREGEQELLLKLNAIYANTFPGKGASIQVETRRGYIVAWDAAPADEQVTSRRWRAVPISRLLRHGLLCLMAGALLWSWIFTFLTDTDAANKITLYANMRDGSWKELAIQLEEEAPEGIRFVQVHPFSYALMDSAALEQADLYIMTADQLAEYADWVAPLPDVFKDAATKENPQGIVLYDGSKHEGAATAYLHYDEAPGETWYLFFGTQSLHTREKDDAAVSVAAALLRLP